MLVPWHDHLPDLGCRGLVPEISVKAGVCHRWHPLTALLGCSSRALWDVATAHFELELRLTHSCTAMVPSTNLGFVIRGFLSAKVEQQEQELDSAACTQLSVAVVFLFPQ